MKFITYVFILVQFLQTLVAESNLVLEACKSATATNEICYTSDEYHSNSPPEESKNIFASVDIREIVDINERKQTLTLLINFEVSWSDYRIQKTNNSSWHKTMDISDHIRNLWIPEMYFSNSVRIEKFKGLKSDSMRQLWWSWWYNSFVFNLVEPFTTEFSCKMNFHDFPFDRHTCMFEIRPTSWFVVITPMLKSKDRSIQTKC